MNDNLTSNFELNDHDRGCDVLAIILVDVLFARNDGMSSKVSRAPIGVE